MRTAIIALLTMLVLPSFIWGQNLKPPKDVDGFKNDCALIDSVEIEFTDTEHLNNIINNLTLLNKNKVYVKRNTKDIYHVRKGILKQLLIRQTSSSESKSEFYGFGEVEIDPEKFINTLGLGKLFPLSGFKVTFPANVWIEVASEPTADGLKVSLKYWIKIVGNKLDKDNAEARKYILGLIRKDFVALLDHTQERLVDLKRID